MNKFRLFNRGGQNYLKILPSPNQLPMTAGQTHEFEGQRMTEKSRREARKITS
jgi:hypothetical protein